MDEPLRYYGHESQINETNDLKHVTLTDAETTLQLAAYIAFNEINRKDPW